MPWLDGLVRPRHIEHIPVVLSRDEVRRVLDQRVLKLIASLLYGSGLRIIECMRLRIKDLDFYGGEIIVRRGKGKKDRVTRFPLAVRDPLRRHKFPNAPGDWRWHWVFPATRMKNRASCDGTTCTRLSFRRR